MKIGLNICGKALQKRLLSLLADKGTFLTFLICFFLLIISTISFGEAWLQWSSDKYSAVFNSFSDNLNGRSLQNRLCQHVPIDVVYTWVNGSDPWFQDSLKHYREELSKDTRNVAKKRHKIDVGCSLDDCVESHFITSDLIDGSINVGDLKSQNSFLKNLVTVQKLRLKCKEKESISEAQSEITAETESQHGEANRTFLVMKSPEAASELVQNNKTEFELGLKSFPMVQAFWTTDPFAPTSYPMTNFVIVKKLPPKISSKKSLLDVLAPDFAASIEDAWIYEKRRLAVVSVKMSNAQKFVDKSFKMKNDDQVVLTKAAYLVLSPPQSPEDDSLGFNRFVDREELRYSLRSIEKYAPWVRRIFLVTNGQIPYWLNLDHPRLTLITHDEIFENKKDLPTFSSPAIEANLYRIPGLTDKFLYMNDDVFLGKEVWPDDFYNEHTGQNIYFSWALPDCAVGCPNSWVKDGYCDRVCNTTDCMFDGGDCLGDQPRFGFADSDEIRQHWSDSGDLRPTCAPSCLDNWLADKFCDESCNNVACGYDGGDCGASRFGRLHQIDVPYSDKASILNVSVPKSVAVAFWNVSNLYDQFTEVGLVPARHKFLRSVGLSELSHVITIVLYPDQPDIKFSFTLQAKTANLTVIHEVVVKGDTTGFVNPTPDDDEQELINETWSILRNGDHRQINSSLDVGKNSDEEDALDESDRQILETLRRELDNEEITLKGFNIKRSAILQRYRHATDSSRKLLSIGASVLPFHEHFLSRKLLDIYGDSLLHVNRLYNDAYGHSARMVVSHMPHLIDRNIFDAMRRKFDVEWRKTSQHRIRQRDDMQFAFAYFHFLMSETKDFEAMEVFKDFDTDNSDTWSDREIRTLLTRVHDLPLTLKTIKSFEKSIIDCASNLTSFVVPSSTPPFERYFDSDLPVVSSDLVLRCSPLVEFLSSHFDDRRRYKFSVVNSVANDVAFKRLTSNISQVVHALDDLRRNPKKFFCLNDNTDVARLEDNRVVHALLVDFLESILPVPSSFELPHDFRNKFTHTFQLNKWKFYRFALTTAAYLCVLILLLLLVAGHFNFDVEIFLRNFFRKVLNLSLATSKASHSKRYTV